MTITLTSDAFTNGSPIPGKYTVDGADVSPPLKWANVPKEAVSLALICDDPDAGGWVHWVAYAIPAAVTELPEGASSVKAGKKPTGCFEGVNGWGDVGWRGPSPPPPSGTHRYSFRLYALDTLVDLKPGATKADLLKAMEGHILATGELVGTYLRQR